MRSSLCLLALVAVGCATGSPRPYSIYVRNVTPAQRANRAEPGVIVLATPITWGNWLDHRDILTHITWASTSTAGPRNATPGAGTAALASTAAQTGELSWDDLPVLPLPSFWVELQNETNQPLDLSGVRFELDDLNGHTYAALTDLESVARVTVSEIVYRHPELASPQQAAVLEGVRNATMGATYWTRTTRVEPHTAQGAYISFPMTAKDPSEFARTVAGLKQLSLRVWGLRTASGEVAAVTHDFDVVRRASSVTCPDGSHVKHWSLCKMPSEMPTRPINGGACIQKTHVADTNWGTQWWAGATPIANSDLERMLLAAPTTHAPARRGVTLRWTGYAMVALGLIGAATVAGAVQSKYPGYGLVGLTPLALLPVGFGMVYKAEKDTERAITTYNAEDEETGACAPVW